MKKIRIYLFSSCLLFFIIDRISKSLIIYKFSNAQISEIKINSFFNLILVWNRGVGFGFLPFDSNTSYLFVSLFIALVNAFLIYWMLKKSKIVESFLISMILGSSIGNLFDRFYYGLVPDFIDLYYKNLHWFTFNVADIFITIGIVCLILSDILIKKKI
jgi:signal peptidase II